MNESSGRKNVFGYDADGRRTDTWYNTNSNVQYQPNGNTIVPPATFAGHITSTFDTAGKLTGLKTTRASSDASANRVTDLTYSYQTPANTGCPNTSSGTPTNSIQIMTDNLAGTATFYCYDQAGRLMQAARIGSSSANELWGYDANNNRTSDPSGSGYTFNSASQQTNTGYSHDALGNMTASPRFTSATYDGQNRNTALNVTGVGTLTHGYTGEGQVERTSTNNLSYVNGLLGVQYDAVTTPGSCPVPPLICNPPSTVRTFYERDPGGQLISSRIDTTGESYYYFFDAQGSIAGLIDTNGSLRATYFQDPYGAYAGQQAHNGVLPRNQWRYAGGYLDNGSFLYKFGHRYYDPNLGRWTQPDPLTVLGDPSKASSYAYVGGDPVNRVDPSGLLSPDDALTAIGVAIDVVGIAIPGLNLATELAGFGVDIVQGLFSDCPGKELVKAAGEFVIGVATFGAIEAAGYATEGAALDALVDAALEFLDYEC